MLWALKLRIRCLTTVRSSWRVTLGKAVRWRTSCDRFLHWQAHQFHPTQLFISRLMWRASHSLSTMRRGESSFLKARPTLGLQMLEAPLLNYPQTQSLHHSQCTRIRTGQWHQRSRLSCNKWLAVITDSSHLPLMHRQTMNLQTTLSKWPQHLGPLYLRLYKIIRQASKDSLLWENLCK